jgi:hypothetical protein
VGREIGGWEGFDGASGCQRGGVSEARSIKRVLTCLTATCYFQLFVNGSYFHDQGSQAYHPLRFPRHKDSTFRRHTAAHSEYLER